MTLKQRDKTGGKLSSTDLNITGAFLLENTFC